MVRKGIRPPALSRTDWRYTASRARSDASPAISTNLRAPHRSQPHTRRAPGRAPIHPTRPVPFHPKPACFSLRDCSIRTATLELRSAPIDVEKVYWYWYFYR
jgi:hypothetical protein